MRVKYKKWPFVIGTICLLAAAALFLLNLLEDQAAGKQADRILDDIHEVIPIPEDAFSDVQTILNEEDNMPDEQVIPDYILNPDMDMPTIEIDGNRYIGTISFPSLDLVLPIMDSWSYPKLRIAPCLYSGSIYKRNAVIAGHNYVSHLGRLPDLHIGDAVCFTDADGNVFDYVVVVQEVLAPTAIDEMVESDADLSLFACTIGGASRFTVRCMQIETPR